MKFYKIQIYRLPNLDNIGGYECATLEAAELRQKELARQLGCTNGEYIIEIAHFSVDPADELYKRDYVLSKIKVNI